MNNVNKVLTKLRSAVDRKKIFNNENPEKVINIVKEILKFNKQQKGKGLRFDFDCANRKIISPKQMLQELTIALAQVQVGNTSENLLNQIIYS